MTVIHGSYTGIELAVLTLWIVAMKCAAMDLSEMDRALGEAVEKALIACGMTAKEAAHIQGMDASQFGKALRGESQRHFSLNRLARLGPLFMVHLTANLMWLTAKQRATEILETVSVRKGA
jgi:hypothetical protein